MQQWLALGLFCLLCGLVPACGTPAPTTTPEPSPTVVATPTLAPTPTPLPSPSPAPTATLGPLTDAEATTLLEQELASRGVATDTVRIAIRGEPRRLAVRYTSTLDFGSNPFHAQSTLIGLAVSRLLLRLQPSVEGGLDLSILPASHAEIGLFVITVDPTSLDAWASGALSDLEFVQEWHKAAVTRE